jgi:hypothetical protein
MNPDSLAAKVIKAKHYHNCSVMEAKLGSKPSHAWRSLMASQALLNNGLLWRIGDGQDVKIWGTHWISMPTNFTMQLPIHGFDKEARVKDLIDQNTKW